MNQDNANPHIIFGRPRYNPAAQSISDGDFNFAQMYPGFEDPTQVPIIPGDTERPMYSQPQQLPQQQLNGQVPPPQLQQFVQMMEQMRQMQQQAFQRGMPEVTASPQTAIAQGALRESAITQPVQHAVQPQQNAVQPIRVPLVFDMTFNLSINLNINPVQQSSS